MCRGNIGDSFSIAPPICVPSVSSKFKVVELDKSDETLGKRIQN